MQQGSFGGWVLWRTTCSDGLGLLPTDRTAALPLTADGTALWWHSPGYLSTEDGQTRTALHICRGEMYRGIESCFARLLRAAPLHLAGAPGGCGVSVARKIGLLTIVHMFWPRSAWLSLPVALARALVWRPPLRRRR